MAESGDPHDRTAEPVTDRDHDVSWSASLEKPAHADDRDLVVEQAPEAIQRTAADTHVNFVTHSDHGHPEDYLVPAIEADYGDAVEWGYVEQCGCSGDVLRVHV